MYIRVADIVIHIQDVKKTNRTLLEIYLLIVSEQHIYY